MSSPCLVRQLKWNDEVVVLTAAKVDPGWLGTVFTRKGLLATTFMHQTAGQAVSALMGCFTQRAKTADVFRELKVVSMRPDAAREGWKERSLLWSERLQKFFEQAKVDLSGIPLDTRGWTPFAHQVYEHVRFVQWGEVTTYGEIARILGKPGAAQAVGRAMAANPVAPVVPCHRVVAGDGSLGGFSATGGIALKAWLLTREGRQIAGRAERKAGLACNEKLRLQKG